MADEMQIPGEGEEETLHEDVALRGNLQMDPDVSGYLTRIEEGVAYGKLETDTEMALDREGLINGGYLFCAAFHTALAALNTPTAVMVAADVKYLAPIEQGNVVEFEARVLQTDTKKREVRVLGSVMEIKIFEALFQMVIFEKHVLRLKLKIR